MQCHNTTNIEKILSYLNHKREYYEKILRLTQRQEEIIKSNNIKELGLIITVKENYIKDIKRLDMLSTKIQEEIASNRETLITDKRFSSLLTQLQSLITKIKDYDQDSKMLLYSSIIDTKSKINNLNKRKRARQSKKKQEILQPSFIDVLR